MNLLSLKEVAARMGGYHPGSIMRLVRQGKFPKPIKLAPNKNAFIEEEVEQRIAELIAERDREPTE